MKPSWLSSIQAVGESGGCPGHSLAETYSVVTRLPVEIRRDPKSAAYLLDKTFGMVAYLPELVARTIHVKLSSLGISGGAVYDALVALAAVENGLPLVTLDQRAAATYASVGATVEVIPA